MSRHVPRLVAALLVLVAGSVRCSSSDGTSPSNSCTPGGTTICAVNTAFSPATLTVPVGSLVTFHNADNFTHTTTSSSSPTGGTQWDVSMAAGEEAHVAFDTKGTYQYYCRIHGSPGAGMHGTVIVE